MEGLHLVHWLGKNWAIGVTFQSCLRALALEAALKHQPEKHLPVVGLTNVFAKVFTHLRTGSPPLRIRGGFCSHS